MPTSAVELVVIGAVLGVAVGPALFVWAFWDFSAEDWRAFLTDANSDLFERIMARLFLVTVCRWRGES